MSFTLALFSKELTMGVSPFRAVPHASLSVLLRATLLFILFLFPLLPHLLPWLSLSTTCRQTSNVNILLLSNSIYIFLHVDVPGHLPLSWAQRLHPQTYSLSRIALSRTAESRRHFSVCFQSTTLVSTIRNWPCLISQLFISWTLRLFIEYLSLGILLTWSYVYHCLVQCLTQY